MSEVAPDPTPMLPPATPPKGSFFFKLDDETTEALRNLGLLRGESTTAAIKAVLKVFGPVALKQEMDRAKLPGSGA